ncbi:MAG: glutamate--tRNA ligase [Candidatus Cloacimonadota bacterium]|nr:MAG: glutamate--tRNA ligase [Candidatus Cloacimonadota bacterium]PIE77689.1 MAG: glutamate--tRNA ligase [Candidatus Delongbacteria bacterium]
MDNIRVRFAPSPTGYIHVGSLRSALYNFLFAKKNGGKLILRVEDTDQSRFVEGAVENLISSMEWAGIEFDESPQKGGDFGPYVQSERTDIYRSYCKELEDKGFAYKCFCSSEDLEKMREEQQKQKVPQPQYDRRCRKLSPEEIEERINNGEKYVVRFKVPLTKDKVEVDDMVYGNIQVESDTIADQVLLKSDGFPTYHLANIVDDHLMKISHVIRGEEWIPSTPLHVALYKAFGWESPTFVHLPLLVNSERKKLSKRHGDVSVESFKEKGILKEALVNYVALLGWHPSGDRELFTMDELIEEFSASRINKSAAVFDYVKLDWINSQYLRDYDTNLLFDMLKPEFDKAGIDTEEKEKVLKVIEALKTRVNKAKEIVDQSLIFFKDQVEIEGDNLNMIREESSQILFSKIVEGLESIDFSGDSCKKMINSIGKENKIKGKMLWMPVRVGLTGEQHGPDLDLILDIFGKDEIKKRLSKQIF